MEKIFNTVKREIYVKVPPEKVWEALTISEERNKWETNSCELDLKIGGKVSLDYGWGVSYKGTIIELEENKKLVFEGEDKELTIWTITPLDQGLVVAIEYTGSWVNDIGMMQMENMLFGTYQFMRNLKSVFEEENDLRSSFWRSWIGVLHTTNDAGELPGSKVVQVQSNTPADGFIQIGDIITGVNGLATRTYDDVEKLISEMIADTKVRIEINRDGQQQALAFKTVPFGQTM